MSFEKKIFSLPYLLQFPYNFPYFLSIIIFPRDEQKINLLNLSFIQIFVNNCYDIFRKKPKRKRKRKKTPNSPAAPFSSSLHRPVPGSRSDTIPTTRKKKVSQSKSTFLFPITLRSSSHVLHHPFLRFTDQHHRSVLLSSTTRGNVTIDDRSSSKHSR